MGFNNFLYYLLTLIRDGHIWQRTNINGQEERRYLFFSILQFVALGVSVLYVLNRKTGIDHDTIDYLLSSLSIMSGMFLALVVLVLEKSENTNYNADTQNEQAKMVKQWRFNRQFVTLTSYAILIALLEIGFLIGILFFGQGINLDRYQLLSFSEWNLKSILLATKLFFVVTVRISVIYFLLNFVLLSVNAVTCIYQSIVVGMDKNKPRYQITETEDIKSAIKRNKLPYKKALFFFVLSILLLGLYIIFIG